MNTQLTKLIGPNWRTTLSGVGSALTATLSLVAAAPYELGDIATIIPPEWKAKVFGWAAVATFILRVIKSVNTKDKQVTGNNPDKIVVGQVQTKVSE
jgi:hypothetical protein